VVDLGSKAGSCEKMNKYDAIVIGAGHNGLTNAAYLAKGGLNVLLVERNPFIGGATVSRELHKDWIYTNCSYVSSLFRPEIHRDLNLARHGLQVVPFGLSATLSQSGDYIGSYPDHEASRREVARHSLRDADAYDRFSTDIRRYCRFIRPFLLRTPADPTSLRPRDLGELMFMAKQIHELGEEELYEFIRFFTMSVVEYLDEYFENELVKASKYGSGIIGTAASPSSPGTAYVLLHHYMGDTDGNIGSWGFARGGMGAIANALAGAFQEHGGELRTDAPVARIRVQHGRTMGVVLEDGEEIDAPVVVSNLDAKRTFLKLMNEEDLPPDVVESARNYQIKGSSGKVNIALDGLPDFPQFPKGCPLIKGDMHITENLEQYDRGYDDWKNGTWSQWPYVDMMIPTLTDPTMAPPGKHMMTVFVQHCPAKLADGDWTPDKREAFGNTVIDAISTFSPNFKDLILHAEVRTPFELESEVGLTEGNIFQGDLSFNQLMFNRPFPGYAQYRGPVKGMYMCGSATHPGGGVMAAPGANAAREILSDLRKKNVLPEDFGND